MRSSWDEICLLQEAWAKLWQMYMTWFAWHFGTHVIALGGVFSVASVRAHTTPIAIFMLPFALFAIIAALRMCEFDREAKRRAAELEQPSSSGLTIADTRLLLGGPISDFARIGTLMTNILVFGGWTYVLFLIPRTIPAASLPCSN